MKNVAFCVPNMIIGGVETVLVNTIENLLKSKDINLAIVLHTDITEPKYQKWLHSHPEIPVYVYYPLGDWFERQRDRCRCLPLKLLRKVVFSLYKKYRRFFMWATGRLRHFDIFVDYRSLDFSKELTWFDKDKIVWIHGSVAYIMAAKRAKYLCQYKKIVGLTDEFVRDFKQRFPQYSSRVLRIYNPVDALGIKELAQQPINEFSDPYFISVSRLDGHQKDIKTLMDAFECFYIKNGAPNVKLVIIGDGRQSHWLREYAKTLMSGEHIIFMGALPNPFGYMKNSMCNILSSNYEGLPTVLIEAQVLDVLNVASCCDYGPAEILLNGAAGILFEVGNWNQLANIMTDVFKKKIISDEFLSVATSGLTRFDPKDITKQVIKVLNED